jgi:hypothetical protein
MAPRLRGPWFQVSGNSAFRHEVRNRAPRSRLGEARWPADHVGRGFLIGPKGDLLPTYSASAYWSDDYAIGLLNAAPDSDPLEVGPLAQEQTPRHGKAPSQDVFALGHNGFLESGKKRTSIVHHANPGRAMGCSAKRSPRMQRIRWTPAGRSFQNRSDRLCRSNGQRALSSVRIPKGFMLLPLSAPQHASEA